MAWIPPHEIVRNWSFRELERFQQQYAQADMWTQMRVQDRMDNAAILIRNRERAQTRNEERNDAK